MSNQDSRHLSATKQALTNTAQWKLCVLLNFHDLHYYDNFCVIIFPWVEKINT